MVNGEGVDVGEHDVGVGVVVVVVALPRQPSSTTSKSPAFSEWNAGLRMSLFHRGSKAPLTIMSEPLSATIKP